MGSSDPVWVRLNYKTKPYKKFFHASYFLGVVKQIQGRLPSAKAVLADLPEEEKEILKAPKTERKELRKSRIGQGNFRRDVIELRKSCCVTKLSRTPFLRASHIKPWSESTNEERLDPYNGLLLCPNYDHLFDHAYISFADDGRILVSPRLPRQIIEIFGVDSAFQARSFDTKTRRYLAHHRARFRRNNR